MLNKNWENWQKSKMKMKINLDHQKGHQLDEAMNENEKEKPTLWMNFLCEFVSGAEKKGVSLCPVLLMRHLNEVLMQGRHPKE